MSGDGSTDVLRGDLTGGAAREHGFLERIRRAFDVLLFRVDAVDEIISDEAAFLPALAMVALAGVAAAAGAGAWFAGYIGSAAAYVLLSLLFAGVVHLAATMVLDARADFVAFYRGVGASYLGLWIAGIPVIHAFFIWALWVWQLAVMMLVAERCYRLERVQAVAVVGIPALAGLFLALLFNGVFALASLLVGWIF